MANAALWVEISKKKCSPGFRSYSLLKCNTHFNVMQQVALQYVPSTKYQCIGKLSSQYKAVPIPVQYQVPGSIALVSWALPVIFLFSRPPLTPARRIPGQGPSYTWWWWHWWQWWWWWWWKVNWNFRSVLPSTWMIHPTTRIPNSSFCCCCTSQKPSHGDISGTESGIIDPLVSKRPEKSLLIKI